LKKLVFLIVSTLLITFASSTAWCDENVKKDQPQTTNSKDNFDHDFENMSKQMTPMFGNMVESMMQGKLKVFSQKETTILLAKFVKNFYDALVSEGFSKEEALKIVTGFGFPAIQ
jgi:hypothetical protein